MEQSTSSEEIEDDDGAIHHPQLIFTEKNGQARLRFNFRVVGDLDENEIIDDMRVLSNEWTSYCISFFRVVPHIVDIGFHVAAGQLEKSVVNYARENAIGIGESETDDGEKETTIILHEDDVAIVMKKLNRSKQTGLAARAMQRSTLTTMLSEYEFLIDRAIERIVASKPRLFTHHTDLLTPEDLDEAKTIEDLKFKIAIKKVRKDLMNLSHSEKLDWITSNLNVNAKPKQPLQKEFFEICQRRHLLMHNGGIVNQKYLNLCVKAGWTEKELPSLGEQLEVDPEYLKRSVARIYQVGIFVLHLLWQSIDERSAQASHTNLLVISHDFLENDLTKMAARIIDFAEFSEKKFNNKLGMAFRINRALSCLFDPSLDEKMQTEAAIATLEKYDWSVTTSDLDLALACVRRDFTNLIDLAKAAQGTVDYRDARTFCVFREARKIEGFLDCFPRAHITLPSPVDLNGKE